MKVIGSAAWSSTPLTVFTDAPGYSCRIMATTPATYNSSGSSKITRAVAATVAEALARSWVLPPTSRTP